MKSQEDEEGRQAAGKVPWNDLAHAAGAVFSLWPDGAEYQWALKAWEALERAGLTAYSDELQHSKVLVRFIALAGIYYDFCEIAWEEYLDPDYVEWAEALGLSPVRVGQLIGADPRWVDNVTANAEELLSDSLQYLEEMARDEIYGALRDHFGGISQLFISLWRSKRQASPIEASRTSCEASDADSIDRGYETDEEILEDMWPQKQAAFDWVKAGCNQ